MQVLTSRVGIVTGAGTARGIGRSAVLSMARAGAETIYACDRRPEDLPKLVQDVKDEGLTTSIIPVVLDVVDEAATKHLCQRVIDESGRLDFYCANAGITDMKGFWQTEADDFRRGYEVMALGAFYAVKYGSQAMSVTSKRKTEARGSIVLTGSIASINGGGASIAYTAAKHAVLGIARRGAIELARSRIRVNALAPGLTETKLFDNSRTLGAASDGGFESLSEGGKEAAAAQKAASRARAADYIKQISSPEEIANVMLFLASDMSEAINAECILADRGALQQASMEWTNEAVSGGIVDIPGFDFKTL